MSWLNLERKAIKQCILINPAYITITRPATGTNSRGVSYANWSSTSSAPITNPVRIFLVVKKGKDIERKEAEYQDKKVNFIITDYESEIKMHDRFSYNSKTWEIQEVQQIMTQGGLQNYQAELKEVTEGNV